MDGLAMVGHMSNFDQTVEQVYVKRLSEALSSFNALCVKGSAHTGVLSQVWMPKLSKDGSLVLCTQGRPFSVSGTGDLLALFRCLSCRFQFGTDIQQPELLGAVGRVFFSGEPEMSCNVQGYDKRMYLRVNEAQRCRVKSSLFMPLFKTAERDQPFAVFEVVQSESDVLFPALVEWLSICLKAVGLYTAEVDKHVMEVGLRTSLVEGLVASAQECSSPQAPCLGAEVVSPTQEGSRNGQGSGDSNAAAVKRMKGCQRMNSMVVDNMHCSSEEGEKLSSAVPGPAGAPDSGVSPVRDTFDSASQSAGASGKAHRTVQKDSSKKARLVSVGTRLELMHEDASAAVQAAQPPVSGAAQPTSCYIRDLSPCFTLSDATPSNCSSPFAGGALSLDISAGQKGTPAVDGLTRGHSMPTPRLSHQRQQEHSMDLDEMDTDNRAGGGAGKRLSLAQLQAQFGVGLKEAAANLNICPTTLKRACRRHNIVRWPRRQLAKLVAVGPSCRSESQRTDSVSNGLRPRKESRALPASRQTAATATHIREAADLLKCKPDAAPQQLQHGQGYSMAELQGLLASSQPLIQRNQSDITSSRMQSGPLLPDLPMILHGPPASLMADEAAALQLSINCQPISGSGFGTTMLQDFATGAGSGFAANTGPIFGVHGSASLHGSMHVGQTCSAPCARSSYPSDPGVSIALSMGMAPTLTVGSHGHASTQHIGLGTSSESLDVLAGHDLDTGHSVDSLQLLDDGLALGGTWWT